ncbi:MAG: TetR/AcrR family transcriptional regulator [Deltaproteobacteria bacterium]|nr:TetR/AcrR family transcriptional regulator [Deltaproteobacteria bacterium]
MADKKKDTRKQGRKDASRRKRDKEIRYAAYTCFKKQGYHDTTVDSICKAAGISKGAFYWHFQSKQDVFLSILSNWAQEVEQELAKQFKDSLAKREPIEAVAKALELEARKERKIMPVWLDFLTHANRDPKIKTVVADFHKRIRKAIAMLLGPYLKYRFNEQEIMAISGVVFAAFLGLICQYLADPDEADFKRQMGRFMPVLKSYLKKPKNV